MGITVQDGKVVMRGDKVGTAQECCCRCTSTEDCPVRLSEDCEDFYPGSPYNCCDGQCKEYPCWPSALLKFRWRKKAGCVPEGYLFEDVSSLFAVNPGEEFVFVLQFANQSCDDVQGGGEFPVGFFTTTGCEITEYTPPAELLECYDFLGVESCRCDCSGCLESCA